MDKFTYLNNANGAFIEDLYQKYQADPRSVDPEWTKFFEGYELGSSKEGGPVVSNKEVAVTKLINAYRARGHLIADTNPVRERRVHKADLSLEYFGLNEADKKEVFEAGNDISLGKASLDRILAHLKKTYCSTIGVEFMYCRDENIRQWIYSEMEPVANHPSFTNDEKRQILKKISEAVTFESFLQTKYVGKKRFSLEGLESLIPALDSAILEAAELGCEEVVIGMAHRGRLNVLVNIFEKSYEDVFNEFEETALPGDDKAGGDVKYHLGRSADIVTRNGHKVHLSLVPNPSHLEAVNPVVEGIVYAKQQEVFAGDVDKAIPIIVHGDAAISGQGVNYEVTNMSKIEGYSTGGTVHIVLNNQVGFTANYKEGRSSVYCTDIAKVTESPVFHVNADDPEAVVHAMKLAMKIRQQFNIDVYVDILGYRRYGHNEGDEPRFTQPLLYENIGKHPDIHNVFMDRLIGNNDITRDEALEMTRNLKKTLQERLELVKEHKVSLKADYLGRYWGGLRVAEDKDFEKSISTKVDAATIKKVGKALVSVPDDVTLFSKMQKLLNTRKKLMEDEKKVDWALAELLAYGTLLLEDHKVRLSGQDSQRGTFSHRHAVIKDAKNERHYVPLNNIDPKQAKMEVYNSFLSEYCVMGFEFGYSLARPNTLVLWEAQFGDFSNGAQIIIDQFLAASEIKWFRMSGLTLLLPHGYEGQGPEHSSARPERFLQLCAQNNMYVCNVTTPANFFHLLRRQIHNPFRKPLVVMSPKSLLRHPKVVSDLSELSSGSFKEIIGDSETQPKDVKRVVCCSGKVYYDAIEYREKNKRDDVAIIRFEQLYPLSKSQLKDLQKTYKNVTDWVWLQEEPANMGYWSYIVTTLPDFKFNLASRPASASPATGSSKAHAAEQEKVIKAAFA